MSASTYNTKQKKLVFELMKNNAPKQLSCDEITYILLQQGTPVGKTTVYRQLERLVTDGKLKKLSPHNSKSHLYQFIDEDMHCEEHMHLRCIRCGRYEHLSCDFMKSVYEHISQQHDFAISNSHTEIMGICGSCAKGEGNVTYKL